MNLSWHHVRTFGWVDSRPRRCRHGCTVVVRSVVGTDRALAATAQAATVSLPRTQAADPPPSTDRHPVRPQDRPELERLAPRTGLRFGQSLPPSAPGVAAGGRLATVARPAVGRTPGGGPDR